MRCRKSSCPGGVTGNSRERGATGSRQGAIPEERERKAAAVMTIDFFIIGLSVILSYDWGSPTPQFRQDAGLVFLFGILIPPIISLSPYTTLFPSRPLA